MSIKDRLSKKTADLVVPGKTEGNASSGTSAPLRTGPGQMLMVNSLMRENNAKLAAAEERLKQYEGSLPVRLLEAGAILPSKWANRVVQSFSSAEFALLKAEIQEAGGNVQPIKVRPAGDSADRFEIVYGHRRHRACLELGLPVLALIDAVSDQELFMEMERENRTRADLSPWEQGKMYRRALSEQLFGSQEQLARELGVDPGNLSKALRLASIDEAVVAAFNSPLDLQYRFAKPLSDALQRDPEGVLARARMLAAERDTVARSGKEVLRILLGEQAPVGSVQSTAALQPEVHTVGDTVTVRFPAGSLTPERARQFADLAKDFFLAF